MGGDSEDAGRRTIRKVGGNTWPVGRGERERNWRFANMKPRHGFGQAQDGETETSGRVKPLAEGGVDVTVATPIQTDWVKSVLFDRGYLARIRGDAIKVYLVIIEATGGQPDRSVRLSLEQLRRRTRLTTPTVIESLVRLEALGLVVSTTHERGKVNTYYVSDPPPGARQTE